jgi:serine/threonine-protein kinase RsbW
MAVVQLQKQSFTPTSQREGTFWVRSAASAAAVLDEVAQEMEAAGYTQRDCFGMRRALEEAFANAVQHGHGGDTSKCVRIGYYVGPDCVQAEVEDQGQGFDPESVPDASAPENLERECGRGLLLMRSLVTQCQFNRKGNRVTLGQCRWDD